MLMHLALPLSVQQTVVVAPHKLNTAQPTHQHTSTTKLTLLPWLSSVMQKQPGSLKLAMSSKYFRLVVHVVVLSMNVNAWTRVFMFMDNASDMDWTHEHADACGCV